MPCEGIFADIRREKVEIIDENTPGMTLIFDTYEKYKNQFQDEIPYPQEISGTRKGIFLTCHISHFRLQV